MKRLSNMQKNDPVFRNKVYILLAELLADQMGGTLVDLEIIGENGKKEDILGARRKE